MFNNTAGCKGPEARKGETPKHRNGLEQMHRKVEQSVATVKIPLPFDFI